MTQVNVFVYFWDTRVSQMQSEVLTLVFGSPSFECFKTFFKSKNGAPFPFKNELLKW